MVIKVKKHFDAKGACIERKFFRFMGVSVNEENDEFILIDSHVLNKHFSKKYYFRLSSPMTVNKLNAKYVFGKVKNSSLSGAVEMPKQVDVVSGFGFHNKISELSKTFFFYDDQFDVNFLEKFFQQIAEDIELKQFILFAADPKMLQESLSLARLMCLVAEYGLESETDLKKFEGSFSSVYPMSLDLVRYIYPFFCFSPEILFWPFERIENALLFFSEGSSVIPHEVGAGLVQSIFFSQNIFSKSYEGTRFIEFHPITIEEKYSYIRMIGAAANNYVRFIANIANFIDENGVYIPESHVKFIATVNQIVADVSAISFNSDSFSRSVFTLNALDKFANIVQGCRGVKEEGVLEKFVSKSHLKALGEEIKKIIKDDVARKQFDDAFCQRIERISNHYKTMAKKSGYNISPGMIFRMQRNFKHGSFLKKSRNIDQFRAVLIANNADIPDVLCALPLLLLLCLLASPERFSEIFGS